MCINRKWGFVSLAAAGLFSLLGTLSCKNPMVQESGWNGSSVISPVEVSLTIPCVSPVLHALYMDVSAQTLPSRAYAFADRMTIVVSSGETEVENLDISMTSTNGNLVAAMVLDPGTYTATVDIYNHQNSTEQAVVRGVKEFTVTANTTTTVSVGCIPINPVALAGEYLTPTLEPALRDWYSSTYYSFGSEAWYSFTAEDTEVNLMYQSVDSGYFIVALYDSTGQVKRSAVNLYNTSSPLTFTDLTVDETYYLLCTSYENSYDNGASGNYDEGSYQIRLKYSMYESITPSVSEGAVMTLSSTTDSKSFVITGTSSLSLSLDLRSGVSASWDGTTVEGTSLTIDASGTLTLSDGIDTQDISVSLALASSLALGDTWTEVSASSSSIVYYAVPVSSGIPLFIEWNSFNNGDGSYSGTCYLSVYDMGTGTSYFTDDYSGYGSNAREVTPAADGYLLLKVSGAYSSLQDIGLRVYEKVNRSPAITSGSIFSLVQAMSSSTTSHWMYYSDLDGDTISASISCTAAPTGVDTASVINSSYLYSSSGYVYVFRNLSAGEYTLTLVLNDGQGYDGSDGINAPSVVSIPITMTITNTVPVLSLSTDMLVCAPDETVSLSFSVPLDPDLDSSTLAFSIQDKPAGATATISDGAFTVGTSTITGTATISPDLAGDWVIAVTGTEAGEAVSGTVTVLVYNDTQGGVEFNVQ